MKTTISQHDNCLNEILVTINGWEITWTWYAGIEDFSEDLQNFILDQSLIEYINFCTIPDDHYYDSHYFFDTL